MKGLLVLLPLLLALASSAQLKSASIEIGISDSAKSRSDDVVTRASHPGNFAKKLVATRDQWLHGKLNLGFSEDLHPHQVFLQLSKGGKTATIVAARGADGSFILKQNLGSTEFLESTTGTGVYELSVVIGDSKLSPAVQWRVGELDFTANQFESKEAADLFSNKPEINHVFRPAEDRPPFVFALLFTGLVIVAFLWLVLQVLGNANWSFPQGTTELLSTFIFQGALGAILCLYILYWWNLNIFQALAFAGVIGVVAVISGNRALKLRYRRRTGSKPHGE